MKISRIGVLFASNIDAIRQVRQYSKGPESSDGDKGARSSRIREDAVVLSKAIETNRQAAGMVDGARQARIQGLKERVSEGSYRIDSSQVAVAVLKELG